MKLASALSSKSIDLTTSFQQHLEVELLLCCSRTHPDLIQRERIQTLVRQPLDWDYVLERATYHQVLPLLDRQLQQIDTKTISPQIIADLRADCDENLHHNLRLTTELLKLSRLFEDRSIPMLTFKGSVLAQLAYGGLGLRQFVDIDILVPEVDVIRASHLLVSQGYQSQFAFTEKQQTVYNSLRNEQWFWHEEKQICIDLHWSILPKYYSFTPDPELLWQKIDRVNFADRSVATISPEHLLLFLCAHGSKHNWSRLSWICDLVELLRVHENLDWEYIHSLMGRFGTDRMLLVGLYLSHQLFGVNLPSSILTSFDRDDKLPQLAIEIKANLFQSQAVESDADLDTSLPSIERDKIYRQTMRSTTDIAWYWIDTILTPTPLEWEIITLPQWLFPLYYVIRAFRLILKHIGKLKV
jgi:hypothetical protein